jgi:hypothetical protein
MTALLLIKLRIFFSSMFSIINQTMFNLADLGPDSSWSALTYIRIAGVLLEVELRYASFTLTINKHSVTRRISFIWKGNYIFFFMVRKT